MDAEESEDSGTLINSGQLEFFLRLARYFQRLPNINPTPESCQVWNQKEKKKRRKVQKHFFKNQRKAKQDL